MAQPRPQSRNKLHSALLDIYRDMRKSGKTLVANYSRKYNIRNFAKRYIAEMMKKPYGPTEAYITLAEPQSKQEQKIDWEPRRCCLCFISRAREEKAVCALVLADTLIAKLKEQMTEYELDKLCA